MITDIKQLSYRSLLTLSILVSIIISLLELWPANPIDPDALIYISAGQAYLQGGWHAAVAAYPWPFFSILGVQLSALTHWEVATCLHIINTFFQALIVVSFIRLVRVLGGDNTTQRWAALIILIYPFLNAIRVYATRDSGYWGLGLLAVSYLIEFTHTRQLRHAVLWGVFMSLAFLFRIEALLMLAIGTLPVLLEKTTFKNRLQIFLKANVILLALAVATGLFYSFSSHSALGSHTRLTEFVAQAKQIIPSLSTQLHTDAIKISTAILNADSHENALTILLGGLAAVYIMSILKVFSLLYFLLAIYGQWKGFIANNDQQTRVLNGLIVFNLIVLAVFTLERYFIATRYPAFMILLWMSWIPFVLRHLQRQWALKKTSFVFPIILVWLLIMAIGGIVRFGYSKTYITEAGNWVNTTLPSNARIFSNSAQLMYYASDHFKTEQRFTVTAPTETFGSAISSFCQYDYLMIRVNQADTLTLAEQKFIKTHTPIKVFSNKRDDQVLVYQHSNFC